MTTSAPRPCPHCRGTGVVVKGDPGKELPYPCPVCRGGKVVTTPLVTK